MGSRWGRRGSSAGEPATRHPTAGYRKPSPKSPSLVQRSCGFLAVRSWVQKTSDLQTHRAALVGATCRGSADDEQRRVAEALLGDLGHRLLAGVGGRVHLLGGVGGQAGAGE